MNAPRPAPPPRLARRPRGVAGGFSLVEVLVTTAVTLVAFTGLVTLQMLAVQAAGSALFRSQATGLAYDIVDRMRLNRGADGFAGTALGGGYDDATLCNSGARHPQDTRACQLDALADLSGTDLATLDLRGWWSSIDSARLPNWYAMIQREDRRFTVAVQWDDARADAAAARDPELRSSCLGAPMPASMQEVCLRTRL